MTKPKDIDLRELKPRDRLIIAGNVEKLGFGHDNFVGIYDEVKLRQFLADKLNRIEKKSFYRYAGIAKIKDDDIIVKFSDIVEVFTGK